MSQEIAVKNLGPINNASFTFDGHGVTVLTAPNGSGKSILLDAMAKMAAGKGRLPLRDQTQRGTVDGFGAHISIGQTTRHTGEFSVLHLEGRFDLAELVDPKMKSADAADRRRIKALVALMGSQADQELFLSHEAFDALTFNNVVSSEALETGDLIEMASYIKRDYEREARKLEDEATKELGAAKGCEEAIQGIDFTLESNAEVLRAEYDNARDELTAMMEQRRLFDEHSQKVSEAETIIQRLQAEYDGPALDECKAQVDSLTARRDNLDAEIAELEREVEVKSEARRRVSSLLFHSQAALSRCEDHLDAVQTCQNIIQSLGCTEALPLDEIASAESRLNDANRAMELGAIVRDAESKRSGVQAHKQNAATCRQNAERLREAAKCTDEVLSSAIDCKSLRVESFDGEARLVTDHQVRGEGVPYHDLSEGERWKIAIDLGAERVGEDGLLVIPQSAWESLDVFARPEIHEHAKARKVYILTAEATRDEVDGHEMHARPYEEVAG